MEWRANLKSTSKTIGEFTDQLNTTQAKIIQYKACFFVCMSHHEDETFLLDDKRPRGFSCKG